MSIGGTGSELLHRSSWTKGIKTSLKPGAISATVH
jgi:hypothetical protein